MAEFLATLQDLHVRVRGQQHAGHMQAQALETPNGIAVAAATVDG